jgi:hypothetical protein
MAKPPAAVVRTFRPARQLQLYGLGARVRFQCTRCRKVKTACLVATMDGDWAQTLCQHCYGVLVHTQREKAKKIAEDESRIVQAKRQPSTKFEPRQSNAEPPRPIARKERQQSEHRLARIDRVLAFFRAAGIDVRVTPDECLWIDGTQTQPLGHLTESKTIEWKATVDELAFTYVRDKFIKAVTDYARFGEGFRPFLRDHERGFAIMRGGVQLAIIYPTHAQVLHRLIIYANFLTPGSHWKNLAKAVRRADSEIVAERKHEQGTKATARSATRRSISRLPDDLTPELVDTCLDASRRIRLERRLAYPGPVILEYGVGELTLMPIVGTAPRLFVPFRLNNGTETMEGALVLVDRDPLPLLIGENVAYADAITAWTHVLIGFADATCVERELAEPTARREPARPRFPASPVSDRRPSMRTLPRRSRWPRYLKPVGRWTRYSGSIVVAHVRRLPDGQTARDEAHDLARQVGIVLGPDETWVEAHIRGVPTDIEMRFQWHAPTELKLFHT